VEDAPSSHSSTLCILGGRDVALVVVFGKEVTAKMTMPKGLKRYQSF